MTCLVRVSRVQAKGALKLLKHHINLRYKRKTDVRASLLVANFLSPFESQRLKTQTIEERIKKTKTTKPLMSSIQAHPPRLFPLKVSHLPYLLDSSLPDCALVMRGLYLILLFGGAETSNSAGLFRDAFPIGFETVAAGFVGAASRPHFRPCSCCWRELED
jgi:hypothetical protein